MSNGDWNHDDEKKQFRALSASLVGLEITRDDHNESGPDSHFQPPLFRGMVEVAPAQPLHADPFAQLNRAVMQQPQPATQWSGLDKAHGPAAPSSAAPQSHSMSQSPQASQSAKKGLATSLAASVVVEGDLLPPSRALLPRPQWHERHTSVFLCPGASHSEVFGCVEQTIVDYRDTQFRSHPTQYLMSAALFNPSCVLFDVTLYNFGLDGVLLEFHRTYGDGMDFFPLYKTVVERLSAAGLVNGAGVGKGLRRFSLPGFDDEPSIDDEDFARLVGMAASQYHDVAREGASALCHLSRHAPNVPFLKANVHHLGEVSAHPDMQVKRCVATLLANISHGWVDGKNALAILVKSLEPAAARPDDLVYMELRRQLNHIRQNVPL